jgi:hypothetical protein
MKLLISPQSLAEAKECLAGGAEIIDVKNPPEGSLGANFPWVIQAIRAAIPEEIPVSATIGDMPFKPGTAALAALGAATAGATIIKVGLYGPKTAQEAIELMQAVKKTIIDHQLPVAIVAAGYAEGEKRGFLDPQTIPEIAQKANCEYAMLDTYDKQTGRAIFDHLTQEQLNQFIQQAHKNNLQVALGGSIQKQHIALLKELQPDIVGVRGAVCKGKDRTKGTIQAVKIREFLQELKKG